MTVPAPMVMTRRRVIRARAQVAGTVVAVIVVCAAAASAAERLLATEPVPLGPLTLRLLYNSGVAFGVGSAAPGLVVPITGLVTLGLILAAWRLAPAARGVQRLGGGFVVGGGAANLGDRLVDGRVTDYLSVGWWPTFNLPDTLIFLGAAVIVVSGGRERDRPGHEGAA